MARALFAGSPDWEETKKLRRHPDTDARTPHQEDTRPNEHYEHSSRRSMLSNSKKHALRLTSITPQLHHHSRIGRRSNPTCRKAYYREPSQLRGLLQQLVRRADVFCVGVQLFGR